MKITEGCKINIFICTFVTSRCGNPIKRRLKYIFFHIKKLYLITTLGIYPKCKKYRLLLKYHIIQKNHLYYWYRLFKVFSIHKPPHQCFVKFTQIHCRTTNLQSHNSHLFIYQSRIHCILSQKILKIFYIKSLCSAETQIVQNNFFQTVIFGVRLFTVFCNI